MFLKLIVLALCLVFGHNRCVYSQPDEVGQLPYPVDVDEFQLNYTMNACKDFIGGKVCCNQANAKLTADNFKSIDGIFLTSSGECDICAINLKRLWCEYACSPRQAEFLKVSDKYYDYPDPQKPGKTIKAQEANLTI